jgi:hypothetical protein
MKRLVAGTDVVSYISKWHPFAPRYAELLEANEVVLSFVTPAEMRLGAMKAHWGLCPFSSMSGIELKIPSSSSSRGGRTLFRNLARVSGRVRRLSQCRQSGACFPYHHAGYAPGGRRKRKRRRAHTSTGKTLSGSEVFFLTTILWYRIIL